MEKYGKSFSELTKEQKIEYIKDYYGMKIICGIIAVIFIGIFLYNFFTPREVHDVDLYFATALRTGDTKEVEKDFKEKFNASVIMENVNWDIPDVERSFLEKIPILIMNNEIDIIALPEDRFEAFMLYNGSDMFMPLENLDSVQDLLAKYEIVETDEIVDYDSEQVVKTDKHTYGIKVNNLKNLDCIEAHGEMVFGIIANTKDIDKTVEVLKYIVD